MDTPFRNDVDALKSRLESLDEQLRALRLRELELETVRTKVANLETEHAELQNEIEAREQKRATPFLDSVRIASPCQEPWDNMVGDERTRFCGRCEKHVHNLSEMTRNEAELFLQSATDSVCVRIYQRADGTVMSTDCPVGMKKKRVRRLFLATVGGSLVAAAGAVAFWAVEETVVATGAVATAPTASGTATASGLPTPPTPPPTANTDVGRVHAGGMRMPAPPPKPKVVPRPTLTK